MAFEAFLSAVLQLISPLNLLLLVSGVGVGCIVGIMPGLGAPIAITVCLPFTFHLTAIQSFSLLLGVYSAAVFGGSVSAITLGIPGTSAALATLADGNAMAKKGRAGEALGLALAGSVFGGIVSAILLGFTAPFLAGFAIKFGPREYLAISVFGIMLVGRVSDGQLMKGLLMAAIGMFLTTFGVDYINGNNRYMFGLYELYGGLSLIAVLSGVFAISEVMMLSEKLYQKPDKPNEIIHTKLPSFASLLKMKATMIRSTLIGTMVGVIPGSGAAIGAFMSYSEAKRASKHPENFGKGEPEGILAPEIANNATVGGALIPTLTLGVPGSPAAAILLGAFLIQGLTAGPRLMVEAPDLMYSIFIGLLIINVVMIFVGRVAIRYSSKITDVPSPYIVVVVMLMCFIGAYAAGNSTFGILVMMFSGVFGYIIRKLDFSFAPLAIGFVLGPLLEKSARQSVQVSQGSIVEFFNSPIAIVIYVILLFVYLRPVVKKLLSGKQKQES